VQRTTEFGYIVEAKKSLPMSKNDWDKYVRQLLKYDDDLTGWWTRDSLIRSHATVLLIEISRSVEFCDYLSQYLATNQVVFDRPFSVVEFGRADEFIPYYLLRTKLGDIEDDDIRETLRKGKKVVIEEVIRAYGQIKFYDSEPEPEFTMAVIWNDLFTEMARSTEIDKNRKAYIFEVDVISITKELQKLYGSNGNAPRQVEFPRKTWVRKAFDAFSRLGYVESIGHDRYRVFYKQIRGDILERFTKQRINPKTKKPRDNGKQLSLFEDKDRL
jgi:hypothetical protein